MKVIIEALINARAHHHRKHRKTGHNILFLHYKDALPVKRTLPRCRRVATSSTNDPTNWICLASVSFYRVQVAVCALCLWDCRLRQLWVCPDEFTRRTEELWISGVNRSPGVAALDILFGFQCCLVASVTFHPLQSSKDWNIHAVRHFGAYLRWSKGLYLAASGCIVLIFLWTLRPKVNNDS